MNFDSALQCVHDALVQMQECGQRWKASERSLEALRCSRGEASALPASASFEAPESVPSAGVATVAREAASPVPISAKLALLSAAPAPAAGFLPGGSGSKAARLAELRGPMLGCTKCPHLAASRTQVVFGVGSPEARVMFVGEAPGEDEDLKGEPFVDRAGQTLTKIIEAMGLQREDVYLANVLKCRPDLPAGEAGNRKPTRAEMQTCLPYLRAQIEIVQPQVLVALGAAAMEGLLGETLPMNQLRGRWHEFSGIPLMATYDPAYLLHNGALSERRKVWEDMLLVLERLGDPISERQRKFFLAREVS